MIIATQLGAFANVPAAPPPPRVIPTAFEINTIGASAFINQTITDAVKDLLVEISDACLGTSAFPLNALFITDSIRTRASQMFNTFGFYITPAGAISYQQNAQAFEIGTRAIIELVHNFSTFRDMANNAFHGNSWADRANNIRVMSGSTLKKIHHLVVFDNTTATGATGMMNDANVLNKKHEDLERFSKITNNAAGDPVMPSIRIFNASDVNVRIRVKIEYKFYVTGGDGAFGPAVQDGNRQVFLNRRFLDYFPAEQNGQIMVQTLTPQTYIDVNFDNKIRGGEAIVEYVPGPASTTWNAANLQSFKFHIRGVNPTYAQVRAYLVAQNYLDRFWFMIRKIRHETQSFGAFNGVAETNNAYEMRHFNRMGVGERYNTTKANTLGLPLFGAPRGFGLGQVDNMGSATTAQVPTAPAIGDTIVVTIGGAAVTVDFARRKVASDQEVWHWKRNIDAAVRVLEMKINELDTTYLNNTNLNLQALFNQVNGWNVAHPTNRVTGPPSQDEPPQGDQADNWRHITYSFVETEIEGLEDYNAIFNGATSNSPNVKSFLDACLLKAYNGYGNNTVTQRNYMYSQQTGNNKPVISLLRTIASGFNYVMNVSKRND